MIKPKLRRIELIPDRTMELQATPALSAIEEMCQVFHLDPHQDSQATRKLRIWHRPCQEQILVF